MVDVVSCLIDTDQCVVDNNSSRLLHKRTAAENEDIKHVWKGKPFILIRFMIYVHSSLHFFKYPPH